MTLLFDQNISFRVTKKLNDVYPDVVHVTDVGLKDVSDFEIWKYATQHSCCIVTFDADFYNLVSLYGSPPKVIWLRTGNTSSSEIIQLFETKQSAIQAFLDDSVTELLVLGCLSTRLGCFATLVLRGWASRWGYSIGCFAPVGIALLL